MKHTQKENREYHAFLAKQIHAANKRGDTKSGVALASAYNRSMAQIKSAKKRSSGGAFSGFGLRLKL